MNALVVGNGSYIVRPCGHDLHSLTTTIRKSCRLITDQVKIRLPISRKLLELMLYELNRILSTQPYLLTLYRALFMLAYYGLMRVGELTTGDHPVLAKDISVGTNKDKILIYLRTSKTHGKEAQPQEINIESLDRMPQQGNFCPLRSTLNYYTTRGNYNTDSEPFFIFQDRTPVTPNHARVVLCRMLCALDLDPDLYGMHSTRSRRASDMYRMGYSIPQIQKAG